MADGSADDSAFALLGYDDPLFSISTSDDAGSGDGTAALFSGDGAAGEGEITADEAAADCDWMDDVDFGSPRSSPDATRPTTDADADTERDWALELQLQLQTQELQPQQQLYPQTPAANDASAAGEATTTATALMNTVETDDELARIGAVETEETGAGVHADEQGSHLTDIHMQDVANDLDPTAYETAHETVHETAHEATVDAKPTGCPRDQFSQQEAGQLDEEGGEEKGDQDKLDQVVDDTDDDDDNADNADNADDVDDASHVDRQPPHDNAPAMQLQVVINPLPRSRRAEYETLPASSYVASVVRRVRGKDRFEVEFDDGARSQIHIGTLFGLPNGQRSLHRFRQKEEERLSDRDSLFTPADGPSKRRKRHHYRGDSSELDEEDDELLSDMNLDTSTDGHAGDDRLSHLLDSDSDDQDDLTDSMSSQRQGHDGSQRNHRRNLRSLVDLVSSGTRHSSRLTSTTTATATATATATEDDEVKAAPAGRQLRSRRSLPVSTQQGQSRGQGPRGKNENDDDADELAGDGDFMPAVMSDIQPNQRQRRGWANKRRGGLGRRSLREDSIELEVRQRPSRAVKNVRSMVDHVNEDDDDDMLYADDGDRAATSAPVPKIVSVKEIFRPLDDNGAFGDVHSPLCDTCGGGARASSKGLLLHCQGCSLSYHVSCIGHRSARDHMATKVGPENFVLQCRFCVGLFKARDANSPDLDCCGVCRQPGPACAAFSRKKTAKQEEKLRQENDGVDPITPVDPALINRPGNVLFRCSSCRLAFHFEHLPPPPGTSDIGTVNGDSSAATEQLRADRLAEYSIDWKCHECLAVPAKIDAIVAWRPTAGEKAGKKAGQKTGQMLADFTEDQREYLVKWEGHSYAHCVWKPGAWVWGVVHSAMRSAFGKRGGEHGPAPVFNTKDAVPEEYLMADVILSVRYKHGRRGESLSKQERSREEDLERIDDIDAAWIKFQGLSYDAVEWDDPPPRDSGQRWDAFVAAYEEYLAGRHFQIESSAAIAGRIREFRKRRRFEVARTQPAGLTRGTLMPYQMEGLNWLLLNFYKGKSVVLADEMGLGKTVQVVALLAAVVLGEPRCWPFLVVVPNATCGNWRREIKGWAPGLRVVTYHGGRQAQQLAYEHELFPNGSRDMHAHVVIMSYDSAQDETTRARFKGVAWAGLVVDEGQRLKNDQSLLYLALRTLRIGFRLLLTGTPLQNNKRELFNLLQFVDSANSAAELDERYAEVTADNLPELHKLIRPYFLRRTKAEVLKFLPPMAQIIVPVSMTVLQEKLCKSIMAKNPDLIRAIFSKTRLRSAERGSLNNILMQLRKCLCHPFIYNDAIEEKAVDAATMAQNLIEASSKLVLLRIMLPKLQARGRRVLLFSQFLHQLDIIEDFLTILGMPYGRLDGSMSSLEKQKRIDAFNAPGSPLFAFLLSTRAGGVGINLATADTVIIMDPDFNPHQDMQAFSRAHRIGQKNHVLCFQLVTKDSVEEKIMQVGRKKMALDHALIESMDAEDDAGGDLESILKHGAASLFSEHGQVNRIVYDSVAVDQLLDRALEMDDDEKKKGQGQDGGGAAAESQFSFARVWAYETGSLADADIEMGERDGNGDDGNAGASGSAPDDTAMAGVWDNIIKEREAEAARLAAATKEVLGRGGRRRTKVTYAAPRYDDGPDARELQSGEEEQDGNDDDDDNDDGDDEFKAERYAASSSDDDDGAGKGAGLDDGGLLPGDADVDSSSATATARRKRGRKTTGRATSTPRKKAATPAKATPSSSAKKARTSQRSTPKRAVAGISPSKSPRKAVKTPDQKQKHKHKDEQKQMQKQKQERQTPVKIVTPKKASSAKLATSGRSRKTKAVESAPGESPRKKARVEVEADAVDVSARPLSQRSPSPAPSLATLSILSDETISPDDADQTISQQTDSLQQRQNHQPRQRQPTAAAEGPRPNPLERLMRRSQDAHGAAKKRKQTMVQAVVKVAAVARAQASHRQSISNTNGSNSNTMSACTSVISIDDKAGHE